MFIILTLIVVVAAFNIISGLTILIKNKTKEIAILKTLVLSNRSIKKTFSYWINNRFFGNNNWGYIRNIISQLISKKSEFFFQLYLT